MNYHILDPRFIYHNAASHKDGGDAFKRRMRYRMALVAQARQHNAVTFPLIQRKKA